MECARWMGENSLEHIQAKSDTTYFRIFRDHSTQVQVWIERHENKQGSIISIFKNKGEKGVQRIIIAQGRDSQG